MQDTLGITGQIALLLATLPVVGLALGIHEAGHVAAGRAVGFRFLLFVIGPLSIARLNERLRLSLNHNLAWYGGVTVVVPRDTLAARQKLRWVMAGGPLASLITGLLALLAWFALDLNAVTSAPTVPAHFARTLFQLFIGLSLGLGLITLLPNRLMGMPSDGARLVELSRNGPAHERDLAVMLLGLLAAGGQRPRAWDSALVTRAASPADDSLNGLLGQLLAYYHELDHGRVDAAGAHLQHALQPGDRIPALYRGTIFREAAFYNAVHRHDAPAARAWLARTQKAPAEAHLRGRAEAAVLLAEGDAQAALHMIDRAERALAGSIEAGMVLAHRDELHALRAAAQQASVIVR